MNRNEFMINFNVDGEGPSLEIVVTEKKVSIVSEREENVSTTLVKEEDVRVTVKYPKYEVLSRLKTVLAGEYAEVLSVYTDSDGNQAVVPPGWTVSGRSEENTIFGKNVGLVIYRIPKEKVCDIDWKNPQQLQRTYDQFAWVPVKLLTPNGTLDGKNFGEKFGIRPMDMYYTRLKIKEEDRKTIKITDTNFMLQVISVVKYGGYYISRYDISKDEENGKSRSIRGVVPWTNIGFSDAEEEAAKMVKEGCVVSHMTFVSEYDTWMQWLLDTGAKTHFAEELPKIKEIEKTGTHQEWFKNQTEECANANVWVKDETEHDEEKRTRGRRFCLNGQHVSDSTLRGMEFPVEDGGFWWVGFRVALQIK